MLLFLLTAEDCSDTSVMDRKEARLTNTYRDIENNFAEDDLSDNTLFAFEKLVRVLESFISCGTAATFYFKRRL